MAIQVVPTLATMAEIYCLSREGGNASPRFLAYRQRVEHEFGLVAYNPMAGESAAQLVQELLALDAERVALDMASRVAADRAFDGAMRLAVIVRSQGMWTDRIATTVQDRTAPLPLSLVQFWSREPVTAGQLRLESAAEAARIVWFAEHGPARTLRALLAREGDAYATAMRVTGEASPFGDATDDDRRSVDEALGLLGESTDQSDHVAVLFGDAAATALGWSTLGVAANAGYRVAVEYATSGNPLPQ
jgi:hypothetical protein